jgi:hypothetical protein
MKMRTIKLTPKALVEALQGKAPLDLPSNMELLDLKLDLQANQVVAVVRSDSFQDLPDTYPIPELTLASAKIPAATQPTVPAVKVEAKPTVTAPTAVAKSQPQAPKKPQPAVQVSRVENEFSPDQRKLLSFKAEGDHVVVKPVQFLKEEWEDINEVVRSCGGRWVKGDIISYWEIPLQ